MPKVAVISIAKNEEQFVERWANSCQDADYRLILDTGSTDNTIELARSLGVEVFAHKFPIWRFDAARELLLCLVPTDIDWVINLDMDEILKPNWRKAFENVPPKANRIRYKYIWSWEIPGVKEGLSYYGDKIFKRHTHSWKHPVHEVAIAKYGEVQHFYHVPNNEALIEHYPDNTKSRSSYLPLLKISTEEEPENDRNAHYYGRELYYHKHWEEAIKELERHIALPSAQWAGEKAFSARYIAKCWAELGNMEFFINNLYRGVQIDPASREIWCEIAQYHYTNQEWEKCFDASSQAIAIEDESKAYLREAWAWGPHIWDLRMLAAWKLGKNEEAAEAAKKCVDLDPANTRYQANLTWFIK